MQICLGNASRKCLENGTWDYPVVIDCQTIEQMMREKMANGLLSMNDTTNVPDTVASIANELQQFTSTSRPLLPTDASSSAFTLNDLIM